MALGAALRCVAASRAVRTVEVDQRRGACRKVAIDDRLLMVLSRLVIANILALRRSDIQGVSVRLLLLHLLLLLCTSEGAG